ncbi:MAG TPA: response regulator transcription factor [Puia sp.]|nr:response regulator transcription factor [Puia sp.]
MKILIADDHSLVRRGLKETLLDEFPSSVVEEAEDAEGIFIKMSTQTWDLVICDLSMPGRSGLDVVHDLRVKFPKLPVLVVSTHAEEHYAVRSLKAGASGFLSKTAPPAELITAINRLLQGRKYITPAIAERLATLMLDNSGQPPHELLSDREFDVSKQIASGKQVSEIAAVLSLSINTISTYRNRILDKMNLRTNAELTKYMIENHLV